MRPPTGWTPATSWSWTRSQKDGFRVLNPFYISDGDWINSIWNTMFTFQGDDGMTTDDAIAMLKDEYDAIFN